ncbi:unnamed protein product, partial [Candida parapsilosis]
MCRAKSSLSSMDSDLEAFSHNPADASNSEGLKDRRHTFM